jgi:hypothetical protein
MTKNAVFAVLLSLTVAVPASAAELTLSNVIEAHQVGVDPKLMIQLIETADSVPEIGPQEESTLRVVGVPEEVIEALKKRSAPQPATVDVGPDDPRLEQVVALVRAGLSEELIVKQIRTGGVTYRPTTRDLIYLTNNKVPESIVSALIGSASVADAPAAPAAAPPAPAPAPAVAPATTPAKPPEPQQPAIVFSPLLFYDRTAGVIRKKRTGRVEIVGDTIRYVDGKKGKHNVELFSKVLKRITLECEDHPDGPVCFELELKTVHGDEYRFRDLNWEAGGSEKIHALYGTLEQLIPSIEYRMKVK